jgi:hypothetical protein
MHVRSKRDFSQAPFEQGAPQGKLRMRVEHMQLPRHIRRYFLLGASIFALACHPVSAQMAATRVGSSPVVGSSDSQNASTGRDGQHDFDWQLGTWKVHMSRLQHPLTGSTSWAELDGTVVVRKIWDGRANLAEIEADGPASHLEFLSLRLYNPQAHQWSLNFSSSKGGTLSVPMIGEFKNGRGEFYDQESFNGRTILVRFVFSTLSPNSTRDEQAFSDDGGKNWEVNWINIHTRVSDGSDGAH